MASAHFKVNQTTGRYHNAAELTAGKYVDTGLDHFIVNELYSTYTFNGGRSQVEGGRKLEFWSQADDDWDLGLWQPQAKMDPLRLEDQGLTGVFYKQRTGRTEFLAFASPLFIPSMGPDVQEKGGSLVSNSRWYRTPSSTFPLFDKRTPIVYSLDIPNYWKLVNNPGAGMRFRYQEEEGFWSSVNYGYKPINSILLEYKKNLFLPEQDANTGQVTIIRRRPGLQILWLNDFCFLFGRSSRQSNFGGSICDPKSAAS